MKKGVIKVSKEIYEDSWHILHLIFKDFKPNYIEFRPWGPLENNVWYFYGTSDLFEKVEEGSDINFYQVVFTEVKGVWTYELKKDN